MLDIRILTIVIAFVSLEGQFIVSDAKDDYCYSVDKHPYLFAGTKTAYKIGDHLISNTSVPNCEPVQIWMLIRHGTRYSGKSEIKNMKNLLPKLRKKIVKNHKKNGSGHLCKEDVEGLKAWELDPNLSEDKSKYLTKQGELDLETLGARFKKYFPQLLRLDSDDLPADRYKFRSTDTQRTVASMDYFINGLFGNVSLNNTEVVPLEQDTLLKLYKICKPWVELMKNESTNAEVNAFIDGPEFKHVVHKVSRRLGFDEDLPFKSVLVMYTACVFERAWVVGKLSPWCAAFAEESLKVFEYEEDLHYYSHDSYGQQLSPRVGCQPLQDMFKHFTQLEKGDAKDEPRGIFYFTHSSMLQLFLTTVGVAEDSTPLTASNYEAERDRKWRTSYLAPFGANFAAVFYRCDSAHKVRFYLNEKPLELEGCEKGVCDWEYLKQKLEVPGFHCNIDFCKV
ncbi:multiple inositol polyphosphate phosphatase 1 [Halictus rubicundus]|uniref:multiple inositol polyphosphate phosphatase 1 n=1 Tax=Halictus rubicundus TaxID=77578 RepID=UPI0040358753